MNILQAQLGGEPRSLEVFPAVFQAPYLFVTPQTEQDIHVAMLIPRACCHFSYEVALSFVLKPSWETGLELCMGYALVIYFIVGLMLCKG